MFWEHLTLPNIGNSLFQLQISTLGTTIRPRNLPFCPPVSQETFWISQRPPLGVAKPLAVCFRLTKITRIGKGMVDDFSFGNQQGVILTYRKNTGFRAKTNILLYMAIGKELTRPK